MLAASSTPGSRPDRPAPWWVRDRSIFAIFLALGLLAFGPVVGSFFVSDDFVYLSAIAHSRWPDMLIWQPGVFRPLHALVGLVDYQIWGLNPVGFHLTNIVSHSVTGFLVFVVTRRLAGRVIPQPEALWAAAIAGLVFLAQPSHTEAVSWVIGRHDIFATLFVLFSWLAYIDFEAESSALSLGAALVAFLIALLFKESVITFPVILVTYEILTRRRFKLPIMLLVVAGGYLLLRRFATGDFVAGYEAAFIRPTWAIVPNLAATLYRSFLPYVPLELLPQAPRIGLTSVAAIVAAIALAGAGLVVLPRIRVGHALLVFLFAGLIISTLPTLAFSPSFIDSESERYAYLPSVFASMIVGFSVTTLATPRAARITATAAIILFLGAFLELSNRNWRTAGELSRGILETLNAPSNNDRLVILVAPDNLNGAFIYRNGLHEALDLFGPQAGVRAPIPIIAGAFLRRSDEVVQLDRLDASHYSIRLPAARGTLQLVHGTSDPALTATSVSLDRVDIALHRPVRVAYYSGGKLQFTELAADSP